MMYNLLIGVMRKSSMAMPLSEVFPRYPLNMSYDINNCSLNDMVLNKKGLKDVTHGKIIDFLLQIYKFIVKAIKMN